jgi:hypothetical protein
MRIRQLKRTAIIVKPKAPYIEWANSLEEGGVKLGEDFEPEHTIYLIEDMTGYQIDIEAMIAPHYEFIFEEELNSWHRLERDWPAERDLATFMEWFEVEYHSIILDLCPGRIKTKRYWRY